MDPRYLRASEVDYLREDATKASNKLGWTPQVSFTELVHMMVDQDCQQARGERGSLELGRRMAVRGVAAR